MNTILPPVAEPESECRVAKHQQPLRLVTVQPVILVEVFVQVTVIALDPTIPCVATGAGVVAAGAVLNTVVFQADRADAGRP